MDDWLMCMEERFVRKREVDSNLGVSVRSSSNANDIK
jgi:hypothetical protein